MVVQIETWSRQDSNPERARPEEERRESQYIDTREAELDIFRRNNQEERSNASDLICTILIFPSQYETKNMSLTVLHS